MVVETPQRTQAASSTRSATAVERGPPAASPTTVSGTMAGCTAAAPTCSVQMRRRPLVQGTTSLDRIDNDGDCDYGKNSGGTTTTTSASSSASTYSGSVEKELMEMVYAGEWDGMEWGLGGQVIFLVTCTMASGTTAIALGLGACYSVQGKEGREWEQATLESIEMRICPTSSFSSSSSSSSPFSPSSLHVLQVSRVVLDMVVRPGWLDNDRKREHKVCRNTDLFRVGEAMFPLVVVVCSRAIALSRSRGEPRYSVITSAASVPAPCCVAWLINNRDWCFHSPNSISTVALPPTTQPTVTKSTESKSSRRHRGVTTRDGGGVVVVERRRDWGESLSAVKEVVAALMGLCIGGHLLMAKAMLGFGLNDGAVTNGGQCLWDGWGVARWGLLNKEEKNGLREKVTEYVREDCGNLMFMDQVCGTGGNLDVVKWLVDDVIGVGEHRNRTTLRLGLYEPLKTCLGRGKMEVFKWLFDKLEMEGAQSLSQLGHRGLFFACALGECPGNFKWCLENLQVGNGKESLVQLLLKNRHTTVKDCQWLESDICEHGLSDWLVLEANQQVEVAKWLLTWFPSDRLDENTFNCLCKNTGDTELVESLITEKNCNPTAESFASACSTSAKHGSSLAKWLSTRVTLSESDIIHSLVQALLWNNTEVAEWLEGTFHVMQSINANTEIAGNALEEICKGCPYIFKENLDGLKWFIKHISSPSSLKMSSIHNAVSRALTVFLSDTAAFVLESFPQFDPHVDQKLFREIALAFMNFNLPALQRLSKLVSADDGSSSLLTPSLAAQCLTSSDFHPYSSKAVKWVIRKFNLKYNHIRANHNLLLLKLLSRKKNGCAQWLLDSFDIPLNDVAEMARTCTASEASIEFNCLDLVGWKLLERHYPTIDAAMIRRHFIPMLSKSPHVAIHTIHSFGITLNEFRNYVKTQSIYSVAEATKIWLGMPLSS
ncbi:hypothetical protein Pelo_15082 [Pelomyxa schiedti]|nr:hypothetical protein Pelo_15082 [Pelomyxa schiedti]